jgi:Nucleotidyl transferase AbiEii toxin, Type IV TA system
MDIAKQIAKYESKGFNREQAEVNTLMESAAFIIFRDFPDAFLLFGGATLVLYHGSLRHSADLDLLSRGPESPTQGEVITSLERELVSVARLMELGEIRFETDNSAGREGRILVTTSTSQRLFSIELTRMGSAIASEIEAHEVEGDQSLSAAIKSATKELLLLQKAESFLVRRNVKARDAYDIHYLGQIGAKLTSTLQAHLEDALVGNEIDSDVISDRIKKVTPKLCELELKNYLPADVYSSFERVEFDPLRDALKELYREWL